ncbi:MAG: biopolymer transporter ExbD [Ferruginibacter sp.]|nr:biopolymer transporter ExbD [Cytophagales bacterium]
MSEVNTGGGGGGKKGGKIRSKKQSTRIDMTPMVDLAFLLLTFFMLATTFSKPKTMELVMPEKPKPDDLPPKVQERNVLTVLLAKDNKVVWYQGITNPQPTVTNYSSTGIRKVLLEKSREVGKKFVVLIKPSDGSTYRNVVDILDEMAITNVRSYALVDIATTDTDLLKAQSL